MKVAINDFARRQTADSRFSHFDGNIEVVAELAEEYLPSAEPGYKDGVLLVSVPCSGFYSGVVQVTDETELSSTFAARREGEAKYVQTVAVGAPKLRAKHVEIVLYRHDVLGDDATTDADWEVISINARSTQEPEPMTPITMARNFLELPGGTKAVYTAEEFARAIIHWSTRVFAG